ncbi:MAG: hypothetical protein S4CHLAM6_09850 [Chlamydiae bacterium]|nr:hypothetical protein [Chlamydiota bacterium]
MQTQNYRFFLLAFLITLTANLMALEFEPDKFWDQYMANEKNGKEGLTFEKSRSFFKQWFLGPLLVPSPINATFRKPALEPSVTANYIYGSYKNSWNVGISDDPVLSMVYDGYCQYGFPKYFGIDLITNIVTNFSKHATYTHFTDTTLRFGYQISEDKKMQGDWTPNARFMFQQIFPTGRFQKLKASRNGIDITGQGSFQSGFYLAAEKGFRYHTSHAYNLYAAFGYIIPQNFRVRGANLYGGDHLTNGKVRPGSVFSVFLSGEFEISKRISIAFDSNYQQSLKGGFTGNMGGRRVNVPQIVTFNLAAPEIEITLTETSGLVLGPWYTLGGQNSPAFVAFFIAYLVVF